MLRRPRGKLRKIGVTYSKIRFPRQRGFWSKMSLRIEVFRQNCFDPFFSKMKRQNNDEVISEYDKV